MSDDVLTIIPTDPSWQPSQADGNRAAALAVELAPVGRGLTPVNTKPKWHAATVFVDCGSNFEEINCPRCGAPLEMTWWTDVVDERGQQGFSDLDVGLPCCGAASSLNDLDYRWPCGFASFDIAIWNPQRPWFDDENLTAIAEALGHPVRQVRAHY